MNYRLKFPRILLMCGMLFAILACSSSENSEPMPKDSITLKTADITLADNSASTQVVSFEATGDWRIISSEDWCTMSPTQGRSSIKAASIAIAENTTTEERTATITLQLISNTSVTASLTVKQPGKTTTEPNPKEDENIPDAVKSSATELVGKIIVGWNLGNTMESGIWDGWKGNDLDIETNWGNPKTTKAMITAIKNAGFNAVRIPVRWYVHADDDLNINTEWINRVKEVVGYAYDQGMYVVLNSHHDNWYDRLPVGYNETTIRKKFENMWKQIATAFNNDYDEHLILSAANEIIYLNSDGSENWNTPTSAHVKFAVELMQLFVNTVRATGRNNAYRCLMVQPWACNIDNALASGFSMPTDNVSGRLILEFHNYTWTYSTESADKSYYFWGKDYSSYSPWYSNGESGMDALIEKAKTNFVDKGVPVIMAEFGSVQHNKSSNENKCDESRAYYHKYVVSKAKSCGIPCFYWDNNCFTTDGENFGLLDRSTCTFPDRAKIALNGIMDGLK